MTGNKVLLVDFDSSKDAQELKENLDCKFESNTVEIVEYPCHYSYFKKLSLENDNSIIVVNYYSDFFPYYYSHQYFQREFIPVIKHLNKNDTEFTRNSELYELNVPSISENKHEYIYSIINGFITIQNKLNTFDFSDKIHSYSEIMHKILEKKCNKYDLSQYFKEIYKNNNFIFDKIWEKESDIKITKKILKFVLGHFLFNVVLRYPGPILSKDALCAYIGVAYTESNRLDEVFKLAAYDGPFSEIGRYYWKVEIDNIVDGLVAKLNEETNEDLNIEDYVDLRKKAIENKIGVEFKFKGHKCKIDGCEGKRGGYFCPYSNNIVCDKSNCSISSGSWLPQGSNICRIQYEFYSKWNHLMRI